MKDKIDRVIKTWKNLRKEEVAGNWRDDFVSIDEHIAAHEDALLDLEAEAQKLDLTSIIFDKIPAELDVISEKKPSIDYMMVSYIKRRDGFACIDVYFNRYTSRLNRESFERKITQKYKTYWRG